MNTERVADWGKTYGHDMAQRQANRMRGVFGVVSFFSDKELEINAERSARSEALDQRIKDADWQEWRNAFIPAYKAAYQQYVAEWQEKQAA